MAGIKDHLDKLKARIEAQNGTVLDAVEGKTCKFILQNGNVFLTETSNHLFGPQ